MAQFCVYRLPSGSLVMDLQSDLLDIASRVVAPIYTLESTMPAMRRLEPILEIEGIRYVLHTAEMAAVPASLIKAPPVADFSKSDYELRAALDMVFSGF